MKIISRLFLLIAVILSHIRCAVWNRLSLCCSFYDWDSLMCHWGLLFQEEITLICIIQMFFLVICNKEEIMNKIKKNWIYYLIIFITFYLIPILIKDTGSGMFILLIVIPLITLITSIIYGLRNTFDFIYPLIVAILFIPTLFIYYNSSAWVYVIAYSMIALIGELLGKTLQRK